MKSVVGFAFLVASALGQSDETTLYQYQCPLADDTILMLQDCNKARFEGDGYCCTPCGGVIADPTGVVVLNVVDRVLTSHDPWFNFRGYAAMKCEERAERDDEIEDEDQTQEESTRRRLQSKDTKSELKGYGWSSGDDPEEKCFQVQFEDNTNIVVKAAMYTGTPDVTATATQCVSLDTKLVYTDFGFTTKRTQETYFSGLGVLNLRDKKHDDCDTAYAKVCFETCGPYNPPLADVCDAASTVVGFRVSPNVLAMSAVDLTPKTEVICGTNSVTDGFVGYVCWKNPINSDTGNVQIEVVGLVSNPFIIRVTECCKCEPLGEELACEAAGVVTFTAKAYQDYLIAFGTGSAITIVVEISSMA